jgi:hypothetical protein
MRIILMLLVNLLIGLLCIANCSAQVVGKAGNRTVGVVFRTDGTPFRANEAIVGIFRRDDTIKDTTNDDGIFCIVIPTNISSFQLVYRSAEYWGYISPEIKSTRDPIKIDKVSLRKKDPNDNAQLEIINTLLKTELEIYNATSSPVLRKAIREELIKLSDSIEIPPFDPQSSGITMKEREMRINARISIDTVVVQMK